MRLLRVCECVYSPLQIQSKADLLCTSQVSQGEKVCSLVFNEKPKKRSLAYAYQAAHTVPKNKRMLLQANRPRQPNSQAPMHKKRQQLRLWWRDGAQKKNPRRSARQQEPETAPRSRQPACEWQCAWSYTVRELQATHSHNSYSSPTHPVAHSHIHNEHTVSGDFTSFIVQSLFWKASACHLTDWQ